MKKVFLAGMLLLLIVPAVLAGSRADGLFQEAVKKYQEADYKTAVVLNEKILNEEKLESAAVYFNLGNASLKQGDLGKAVFNYRRARAMAPRDADIRANLLFARSQVGAAGGIDQEGAAAPFWFRPYDLFSSGELKWGFVVLVMLTGGVWMGGLLAKWPFKRLILAGTLAAVCSCWELGALLERTVFRGADAVLLERAEARFEPSGNATVYFNLPEGAEVRILRRQTCWSKIQRADGRVGWVGSSTMERI